MLLRNAIVKHLEKKKKNTKIVFQTIERDSTRSRFVFVLHFLSVVDNAYSLNGNNSIRLKFN